MTVNPGCYGKRLAEFLSEKLNARGIVTSWPDKPEDWGWEIAAQMNAYKFRLGCGHSADGPDTFLCFFESTGGWLKRLFEKHDKRQMEIHSLQESLDAILSSCSGVHDIRWYTQAEFHASKK